MVRRPHLPLVPPRVLRPGLSLLRPSRRTLGAAAAALAVLALAYLTARETALFALERVEVRGAPSDVRAAVLEAADRFVGESLVAVDGDELERTLEALPSVRSISYDRAFPHTLRLLVRPERPAAVLRRGRDAWLVSERGRVIRVVERDALTAYPRIWLTGVPSPAPGSLVSDTRTALALRAIRALPQGFPARVRTARVREEEGVTFVLVQGTELLLGEAAELPVKLAVAARVLGSLPANERAALAYLDVTVPARPVGAEKSQLSGQG
ncbi:MAG: cell division protein FtsQ/DivIB [Gaiellaceae bacterium]